MLENTATPSNADEPGREPIPALENRSENLSSLAFYLIVLVIVGLDQAFKEWVIRTIPVGGSIPLLSGVFHLTHTQNRGMAFSLLEGKVGFLAVAAIVVALIIVGTQIRLRNRLPVLLGLALSLPLGGAIGNLIDRVRLGYVTDMLDFRLINFPVFNIADSAITVGVILLGWYTLTMPDEPTASPKQKISIEPTDPQKPEPQKPEVEKEER
ncbi:MAG: hypothetical protein OHK0029_02620 [Armatimonadaceae bacterium]